MAFKEISAAEVNFNPFTAIGKDWMLITAGDGENHNNMTASWGGVGELWGKPVSTVYIRPQRHTLKFVDEQEYYSLCFFDEKYRDALMFCGTKSGRDFDKDKETGLTAVFDREAPYYEQAKLVFICRKLYRQDMAAECFIDKQPLEKNYPNMDLHKIFVGEIVHILEKE